MLSTAAGNHAVIEHAGALVKLQQSTLKKG